MSVRSFDKIVNSPEPLKLSTLLLDVRQTLCSAQHAEYICNASRWVAKDLGFDGDDERSRVSAFLEANGISTCGHWFRSRGMEAEALFRVDSYDEKQAIDRATRLAVLDVLIHQLLQRGE